MGRDSMVFYTSWLIAVRNLPREIQGEVLTAILEYGLIGETTESLKPIAATILELVKPQIDTNQKRYENSLKGGRKKQEETETQPKQNQIETKLKPKVNQTQTYNDNVYVYDNDMLDKSNNTRTRAKVDLSYVSQEYKEAFTKWLEYKKARKESYKSNESVKECYDKLLALSGNNPATAMAIVKQSMANNWAGLFELKQKSNNGNNTSQDRKHFGTSEGVNFTPRTDIEI
jgi:hypothetical protein